MSAQAIEPCSVSPQVTPHLCLPKLNGGSIAFHKHQPVTGAQPIARVGRMGLPAEGTQVAGCCKAEGREVRPIPPPILLPFLMGREDKICLAGCGNEFHAVWQSLYSQLVAVGIDNKNILF